VNESDIKAEKTQQVGYLSKSIAQKKELVKTTESVIYANITDLLPIADTLVKQRGTARGSAFILLFESIARQREAHYILDDAASHFLGEYDISQELTEFPKTFACPGLIEGIARQPEMQAYMAPLCVKYFHCDYAYLVNKDNCSLIF
jgi:hypothetical protein